MSYPLLPAQRCVVAYLNDLRKRAKITPAVLYPTAEELGKLEEVQKSTGDLEEILALLDTYMVVLLDFFDSNVDKSILPLPQSSAEPTRT